MDDVAVLGIRKSTDATDVATGRCELGSGHRRFNAVFDLIGKFGATDGKEFDAVVGGGVVRCGDHHAEVGTEIGDEEGGRGGRDHSGVVDVHAGTGEPCRHNGRQELTRYTGITRYNGDGSTA